MRTSRLVPALALAAGLAAPAAAVELGPGVTLGGFVDTWFQVVDSDSADDMALDFFGEAQLNLGVDIGDTVHAQLNVEFYGDSTDPVYVEEATVTWQFNEKASVMMGEFIDWLGWEAANAPDRYRFDRTFLVSIGNFYGAKTVTGAALKASFSETMNLGVFLVDDVYGDASASKASDELGLGLDFSIDVEGYGNINLEMAYDQGAAPEFGGAAEEDVVQFGVNTTYTGTENLTVGAELHFLDYDAAGSMGFMAMANYAFSPKASASIFAAYIDPNDDADDDEGIEVALALLTCPTDDTNFAVNFEIKFQTFDDANPTYEDNTSFFIEMLGIIP